MAEFKLKYVFIINGILAFFFGLMFIFLPDMSGESMGLNTYADDGEPLRFLGATFVTLAILMLGIRNEPNSHTRQVILFVLVFNYLIEIILHLLFHSLTNPMVLVEIVLCSIWVILYGFFFIKNREK